MFAVCRDTYVQQEAGESPNDRNDRAIRVAAAWYTARLPGQKVILLTDDADNRRKAKEMGVETLGSAAYAKQRAAEQPELQDLVTAAAAAARDEAGPSGAAADGPGARRVTDNVWGYLLQQISQSFVQTAQSCCCVRL